MNAPLRVPIGFEDVPSLEPDFPWPDESLLVETDGEPLESDWHRLEIGLLADSVRYFWRDRDDFYVAGNMFIYFNEDQLRNLDFRGPDFFLVKGVSSHMRRYWWTWKEGGRFPNLLIELMSPTTKKIDLTVKKAIYEQTFRTPEYFAYDPDEAELLGWRLVADGHEPITPGLNGWLWCNQLGLWLGKWHGTYQGHTTTWLRFFDTDGKLILTLAEAKELEAEAERQRAAAANQRADAAEAELVRLRKLLEEKS